MRKTIMILAILGFMASCKQHKDTNINLLENSLEYKVSGYHLQVSFLENDQLIWKYLDAPDKTEIGKSSVENITKNWINDHTVLVSWTEATGANVVDVFDFKNKKVYVNFVLEEKLYNSETTFKFIDRMNNNQNTEIAKILYKQEKVTFKSGENNLKGILFTPNKSNNKTVVVIGPVGYVKEQAPMLYAQSFATKGYNALIFDPTYHGESEGQPRSYENGDQKTKDIIASVDYLKSLSQINTSEIYGVGVCQGINWMTRATNQDDRIKKLALVAGHYLDDEVAVLYNGGKERLESLLHKSVLAKEKFLKTGEVEYIPIVGTVDQDALLAAPPVYDWYIPWENNANGKGGKWKNRITRMSVLAIWGGNTRSDLENLIKPTLVIHSNKAASGPNVPKKMFEVIPTKDKKMIWFEDQFQTMFYDDLPTINRAVEQVSLWFNKK